MHSICVTGATGSFGQALVKRLLGQPTERIVVFSRDEWKQARMAETLRDDRLRYFIGDVRDRDRLEVAFAGCEAVVHAAALKRVDSIAYNPIEVKRTNVDGTENVLRAAIASGIKRVLVISSDKAVHPTNVYGASKQMAEHLTIAANAYGQPRGTKSAVLRYGNVLGSRGSVIHLWRREAGAGRPLTVTDTEATRFWLSLDDAVGHALAALNAMTHGGEVFVPFIKAMPVLDVAKLVATEYGAEIATPSGLRPGGEKLHEQLASDEEVSRTALTAEFLRVLPAICTWTKVVPVRGLNHLRYTSDVAPYGHYEATEMTRLLKDVPCEPS